MSSHKLPIAHVAQLARLELTHEEEELFEHQLESVLGMIDKLRGLDLSGNPEGPVVPAGLVPVRNDEPVDGLETSAALSNAPAKTRDQFMVPRVIDAE